MPFKKHFEIFINAMSVQQSTLKCKGVGEGGARGNDLAMYSTFSHNSF